MDTFNIQIIRMRSCQDVFHENPSVVRKRVHSRGWHAERRKCILDGVSAEETRTRCSQAAQRELDNFYGIDVD